MDAGRIQPQDRSSAPWCDGCSWTALMDADKNQNVNDSFVKHFRGMLDIVCVE